MRQSAKALLLLTATTAILAQWFEGPLILGEWRRLDPNARQAIELQCRSLTRALRASCEREAAEALRTGTFDPERILRVHCTRFDNDWETRPSTAPELCVERYGGWLER